MKLFTPRPSVTKSENLYYVPVEKRTFRDITILIIDIAGNPIAFPDSKIPANVVVHFRLVLQYLCKNVLDVVCIHSELWIHLYGTVYIKRGAVTPKMG